VKRQFDNRNRQLTWIGGIGGACSSAATAHRRHGYQNVAVRYLEATVTSTLASSLSGSVWPPGRAQLL